MGIDENEALVRGYYKTAPLWLPPNAQWRHFRFFLFDGTIQKIPDRITTTDKLRAALLKYAPAHAYYSCSMFLNPTIIRKRGPKISENHFMGTDAMYYDIDKKDIQKAKVETKKLVTLLEREHNRSRDLMEFIYSGSRGFHIKDFKVGYPRGNIIDPREWEMAVLQAKKEFILDLEGKIDIDAEISYNTRCIIRLPGTIHGGTGNLCEKLEYGQIDNFKPKHIIDFTEIPKALKLSDEMDQLREIIAERGL